MVRKVVSELVSYVNSDLLERNAAKFIPGLSRRGLFKKPRHWDRIFPSLDHAGLSEDGPISFTLKPTIEKAQRWLLQRQRSDGHWVADLRADTTLESDMIMLYVFLGWHTRPAVREKMRRLAFWVLEQQQP